MEGHVELETFGVRFAAAETGDPSLVGIIYPKGRRQIGLAQHVTVRE